MIKYNNEKKESKRYLKKINVLLDTASFSKSALFTAAAVVVFKCKLISKQASVSEAKILLLFVRCA